MAKPYNHKKAQKYAQELWEELKITKTGSKDKYYCLDMFPYPSGKGLHVGHWRGYTMSDFYTRHAVLSGKSVLHPMGFDAFGLPAENAAIKHNSHPKKFTDEAIKTFTKQLNGIGAWIDWDRAINTSSPEYYKWTQWLFLQLHKHGYTERRKSYVNWCPKDQTVLANEQVVDGCCDLCGSLVTKKELDQWYVLTTKLAEELLGGLDGIDWPDRVKTMQRNWIGKSSGARVAFKVEDRESIEVFTTRPDTIFGVTAIVLSPEHHLSRELCQENGRDKEFEDYYKLASAKTNIDRQQAKETEKTAIFTGSYAIHPLTNEELPIWVADYVLMEYGTGAVMSVPAHDERDFAFANTHNLPIKQVVSTDQPLPCSGEGKLINSGEFSDQPSSEAAKNITSKLKQGSSGREETTYRLRDWLVSRQRYWGTPIPIVYDPEGNPHPVKDEHLPLLLPEDVDFMPGGESPLASSVEYKQRAEKLYGPNWHFETDTLDTFVDSSWYYLRYLTPNDDSQAFDAEEVGKWLPVDLYVGGIEHATLHLLYSRFVYRFLEKYEYIPKSGGEPFRSLFNIGMITLHGAKMSKSKGNIVSPDPLVEHYGTDALRGYELFVGPLEDDAEWSTSGINGVHRFLIKIHSLAESLEDSADTEEDFYKYLANANQMIANYRLNTLISEYMKLANKLDKKGASKDIFSKFLITLSPAFPHLAEYLWNKVGNEGSIFSQSWPKESKDISKKVMIPVLINQRFICSIEDPGSESKLAKVLEADPKVVKQLKDKKYRTIYKSAKVVNIIVD